MKWNEIKGNRHVILLASNHLGCPLKGQMRVSMRACVWMMAKMADGFNFVSLLIRNKNQFSFSLNYFICDCLVSDMTHSMPAKTVYTVAQFKHISNFIGLILLPITSHHTIKYALPLAFVCIKPHQDLEFHFSSVLVKARGIWRWSGRRDAPAYSYYFEIHKLFFCCWNNGLEKRVLLLKTNDYAFFHFCANPIGLSECIAIGQKCGRSFEICLCLSTK